MMTDSNLIDIANKKRDGAVTNEDDTDIANKDRGGAVTIEDDTDIANKDRGGAVTIEDDTDNPIEDENSGLNRDDTGDHDTSQAADYKDEAKKLRRLLRLYFYSAFKFKLFKFGNDRGNFSSVVDRGHLVLRHLLLENWDASWETLPYPPAHGDFAVYTIDDLEKGINYAVKNYYNAEREAIGYYVRTADDKMTATMKYFDFPGFHGASIGDRITISEKHFRIDKGLTEEVTNENETVYSYNISREFAYQNLSQPVKRMLSTTLHFKLHSVRSHESSRKATCLRIEGSVKFEDLDNNGQVLVNLHTKSSKIRCKDMNLSLSDWQLETSSDGLEALVIVFCIISLLLSISTMIFAAYTFWRTKQFMRKYYKAYFEVKDETDLPVSEYFRFLKFWDITVVISDILTLYGTVRIAFHTVHSEWVLGLLDSYAVWLGVGCVIAWLSLLRFFKFHNKFHLLFNTLYKAFWNVVAYLICVGVLFVGFWVCGYVVLAPYHVKFKTPAAAAETLFAVVYGDEIYATLAILESDKSGGNWVWWFSRFYLGTYIAIYTVVVINLLIALFMSAYESIKAYYEQKPEERELGPMEKALVRALIQDDEGSKFLRSWIYCLMNDSTSKIQELNSLKTEFSKFVRVSKSENNVVLLKPRTLKVFMEDKSKTFKCGFVSCSFTFSGDDQKETEC